MTSEKNTIYKKNDNSFFVLEKNEMCFNFFQLNILKEIKKQH